MRNIRNLKDPTSEMLVMLLLGWLLNCCLSTSPAMATTLTMVSCTDHDTKITCNCNNDAQAMVLPQINGAVYHIEVRNCRDLTVESNALERTEGLRKISFHHLSRLVLQKHALSLSRYVSNKALIVEFEDVNFELIDSHAISGNIEEISFVGGRIEQMQPFGFTTTKDSAILLKLDGVTIQRLESQAFKKFAVEQMIIANCKFLANVPTRAFYELEVLNELSIRNNQFQEVHSHAFTFKLIFKLSLSDNSFVAVDGEWLEAQIRDGITLRGNRFGATSDIAFRSLKVHRDYQQSERLELRFHNNTVHSRLATANSGAGNVATIEAPPQPLRFDERFAVTVHQLRYQNVWSCDQLDMTQQPAVPRAEFFRLHADQLLFSPPTEEAAATADAASPAYLVAAEQFVPLRQVIVDQCRPSSNLAFIVVGSVVLAVLLLLLLLMLWWLAARRRRRKLDVVQPESRTYKETQIVYQIENAGLLKTDL